MTAGLSIAAPRCLGSGLQHGSGNNYCQLVQYTHTWLSLPLLEDPYSPTCGTWSWLISLFGQEPPFLSTGPVFWSRGLSASWPMLANSMSKTLHGSLMLVESLLCNWNEVSDPFSGKAKIFDPGARTGPAGSEWWTGSVTESMEDCFLLVDDNCSGIADMEDHDRILSDWGWWTYLMTRKIGKVSETIQKLHCW